MGDPWRTLAAGAAAGTLAAAVQAMAGKAYERGMLPRGEDSDVAPRLVHRISEEAGHDASRAEAWVAGTLFHFGYGGFWGAMYGLARERWRVPPTAGGAALGAWIYLITFPRWGGAVRTGTVAPAGVRSERMTGFAVLVTATFGLATAAAYEMLRGGEDGGEG